MTTASPVSSTLPAASWPSTTGGRTRLLPSSTFRSLWQIPDARTRTTTSPDPGSRSSTSSTTASVVPSNTAARKLRLRHEAAVLDLRLAVVAVHVGDEVEADLLRTRRVALAVVRARAEPALHLLHHALDARPPLGLTLRQHVEVGDLGRREQLGRRVRARRHARAALDAGGGVHGQVGDRLRDEDEVGVGRRAGGGG